MEIVQVEAVMKEFMCYFALFDKPFSDQTSK